MAPATAQSVDFTNVKEQGEFQPKRVPEGDYVAVVKDVMDAPVKDTGEPQWAFKIVLKGKSGSYPYRVKLVENQLWKLRNLCVAAGMNVPKKRVKVDPNKLIGKTIGVTMSDTEYKDRQQSEITAIFPASDIQDTVPEEPDDNDEEYDEEEEEPTPRSARHSARPLDPEPEEDEDEEEDEEDEEEPEPTPPPRRAAKKTTARRPARKSTTEVTDDEMEELDIDEV